MKFWVKKFLPRPTHVFFGSTQRCSKSRQQIFMVAFCRFGFLGGNCFRKKNVVDCSVAEISLDLSDLGSLSYCMSCLARFLSVSTSVCGRFPPTNWGPSPAHLNADFAGDKEVGCILLAFQKGFLFRTGGRNNYFRSLQAHVQNWCILTLRFSFEDAPAS